MTQYISNTTQKKLAPGALSGIVNRNTALSKARYMGGSTAGNINPYGQSQSLMPTGTAVNKPQAPVTWGIPQTDISKVSAVGFGTANSTAPTTTPSATMRPGTVSTNQAPVAQPSGTTTMPSGTTQTTQPSNVRGIIPAPSGTTTTTQPQKQEQPRNMYSETVQGIVDRSKTTKDQDKMLRELRDRVKAGESIADAARAISEKYASEINRVGQLGAGAVAGSMSTGTNVVGSGNAAIASQSASERMNALSAAQQAELAGNTQQLTANTQGISALTNALGAANTQQQIGIQGLGTAAGYAQPAPAAYGQAVFNPLTGQYEGGGAGNLNPQAQAQNLAQQVMSGAMTYDQALASLGYAGNVGTNFLNNALTAAGGNPLQLQAQGAAQQANIQTGGTAQTDIARMGLADATQNYVQMNTAAQYATQQSGAVANILAKTGLNNVSSTDYNKAINSLQSRFSDVDFQAFNTALVEAQNAYSQLLSLGGGTPTGREASALATLNSSQSAAAINASIRELDAAVQRRLQAQYSAMQTYQQNMPTGTQATGGGNYPSGSITWESLLD